MKTEEILRKVRLDLDTIKSNPIIRQQYKELENFLISKNIEPIHSFGQLKRNQQFKGLISETMFFDNKFIYDLVVGVDNIDTHIVLIEHISKVSVATIPNYINEKDSNGTNIQRVELNSQLTISYQEQSQLYYQTPIEKFQELLKIADILTKMIGK